MQDLQMNHYFNQFNQSNGFAKGSEIVHDLVGIIRTVHSFTKAVSHTEIVTGYFIRQNK